MEKTAQKPRILPLLAAALAVAAAFALYVWRSRAGMRSLAAILAVAGAAVICLLLVWRVYVLLFTKRAALARVFAPAALLLGLLFGLAFPPGTVPDEFVHADAVCLYANRILGVEDTPSEAQFSNVYRNVDTAMRQEDARERALLLTTEPSLSAYRTAAAEASFWYDEAQSAPTPVTVIDPVVPPVVYGPAIVGMLLGRTVHLGYYPLLLFCRLCMLLFYVCMTAWALRLLPFGKAALFVAALVPMALHLACSLSYDAVILALAFALLASILDMAYGPHARVTWRQAVRTAVLAALLACCKVGAYLPLVFLVLLIPRDRFVKKGYRALLFLGLLAAGLLVLLLWNLDTLAAAAGEGLRSTVTAGTANYAMADVLARPLSVARMMLSTVIRSLSTWALTCLGYALGWLNVLLPQALILAYAVLLVCSCLHPAEEPLPAIRGGQRLLFLVPPLLTLCAFLVGMLLWWTPAGSQTVEGIQGRYFLPVIPCLLLALPRVTYAGTLHLTRKTAVPLGAQPDRVIAFLAVLLACLALAVLYPTILAR